ncbi:hypothetical protein HDU67_006140, partial [Dinochytrium kinnereticum]
MNHNKAAPRKHLRESNLSVVASGDNQALVASNELKSLIGMKPSVPVSARLQENGNEPEKEFKPLENSLKAMIGIGVGTDSSNRDVVQGQCEQSGVHALLSASLGAQSTHSSAMNSLLQPVPSVSKNYVQFGQNIGTFSDHQNISYRPFDSQQGMKSIVDVVHGSLNTTSG